MTLAVLRGDPQWQVVGLLTTVTARHDRIAMHGVRRDVLHAQAAALSLPLVEALLEEPADNESYERAFTAALQRACERWPDLQHCAFGDLFLEDVRAYRERQLTRAGWQSVFPLWGEDTTVLSRHFVDAGHRAAVVCVDTTQLPAEYCGRDYDRGFVDTLPDGVDPCGENGEFHTLSHAGPLFTTPLPLRRGASVLRDQRFQYTDFLLNPA